MCDAANDGHDDPEAPRVPADHWWSVLGNGPGSDGMVPLTFRVSCYVTAPSSYYDRYATDWNDAPCPTTYNCAPNPDIAGFKRRFQQAIHDRWNNKLWLAPRRRTRRHIRPIKCGISLTWTEDRDMADCVIVMLNRPSLAPGSSANAVPFRAFCDRVATVGDEDMVIDYPASNSFDTDATWPTSNHGEVHIQQNYAAHEFGHYLGLDHTCYTPATANTGADYCGGRDRGRQRNIMSVGNVIHREHGRPWRDQLASHHHHCGLTWRIHTHREPVPR